MLSHQVFLLVYFLVAINFLFNKMKDFSCHVQTIVNENLLVKHGLNILGVFFLLVLFTRSTPVKPMYLILGTFIMYAFFMLITKCDYRFLGVFLLCMFVVFYLESDKLYKASKNSAQKDEIAKKYEKMQLAIQAFSCIVVLVGFVIYLGQHAREYKRNWDWRAFWLGVHKCAGNGSREKSLVEDFSAGIKRLI